MIADPKINVSASRHICNLKAVTCLSESKEGESEFVFITLELELFYIYRF
jgi:hypothetical protein